MQNKEKSERSLSVSGKNIARCAQTQHTPQKCDAKHPCTTCINAHTATECEYEIDDTSPSDFDNSQILFWDGPSPSGSKDVYRLGAVGEMVSEPPTSRLPAFTQTRLSPKIAPPDHALIRTIAYNSLLFYSTPPGPRPRTSNKIMTYSLSPVTLPPLSAISSLVFPSVPPGSHVTLSSLGTGGFQLSDVALRELSLKL